MVYNEAISKFSRTNAGGITDRTFNFKHYDVVVTTILSFPKVLDISIYPKRNIEAIPEKTVRFKLSG